MDGDGEAEPRPDRTAPLSIGELAEVTGLTTSTLRAWESRYGFPQPHRPRGGHRRFTSQDVTAIAEVRRRRAAGVRLDIAIAQVREELSSAVRLSVFPETTAAHPQHPQQVFTQPTLLAISRAIEDEITATAPHGHLFGAFQAMPHYEAARDRWSDLARTAASAHVFAHGPDVAGATYRDQGPLEPALVALPADAPMVSEWILVCDGAELSVALLAIERPGQSGVARRARTFEVVWTFDPAVVRDAARRCAQTAATAGSQRATELLVGPLAAPPRTARTHPLAVERLVHRTLRYLEEGRSSA